MENKNSHNSQGIKTLTCVHYNTMFSGNGRSLASQMAIHYHVHSKALVWKFLRKALGFAPVPFSGCKNELRAIRKKVEDYLQPQKTFDTIDALLPYKPIYVLWLSEVLKSQREYSFEQLGMRGFSGIHSAKWHKTHGTKDRLGVILATKEPSEKLELPIPFEWKNTIGWGGGAVLAEIVSCKTQVLYIHLASPEYKKTYASQLEILQENLVMLLRQATARKTTLILMGDFNASIAELTEKVGALSSMYDCIGQPNKQTFLQSWCHRGVAIDHIFAYGINNPPNRWEIITDVHSDHAAVRATIDIPLL